MDTLERLRVVYSDYPLPTFISIQKTLHKENFFVSMILLFKSYFQETHQGKAMSQCIVLLCSDGN